MSTIYLEGPVTVGTFAGPQRPDKKNRRCVQITTREAFVAFNVEELPAVLEALTQVRAEEL